MAEDEKKRYPTMPAGSWWALRKRFKTSLPSKITPSYCASALSMTEISAKNNIIPSLHITGLVDKDGKPTDLAVKWRDDSQYTQVCNSIRSQIYPQELLDLAPETNPDRGIVQSWIANHLRVGENAAGKIAAFYVLLSERDVTKENKNSVAADTTKKKSQPPVKKKAPPVVNRENLAPVGEEQSEDHQEKEKKASSHTYAPAIHLNIQIHISSDSSADQIDAIFSSMAKYLKDVN